MIKGNKERRDGSFREHLDGDEKPGEVANRGALRVEGFFQLRRLRGT